MDAQVHRDTTPALSRNDRRRNARTSIEGKLQAAFSYIRELEVRCLQHDQSEDAVVAEVEGRLGLIRPMISALVTAGQASTTAPICGSVKAFRNFAVHAELGCGAPNLPKTASDAKWRNRGSVRMHPSAKVATDCECLSPVFTNSAGDGDESFNERFNQALLAFNSSEGCNATNGGACSGRLRSACFLRWLGF